MPSHPCSIPECPHPGIHQGASPTPEKAPWFCAHHKTEYYLHNRGWT